MAWNKNVNTNAPSKNIIANLLKAGVAISFTLFLVACGGDSGSSSDSPEKVVSVSSIDELDDCSEYLEGDTVFVKNEKSDFVCIKGKWTKADSLDSRNRENNGENEENNEGSSSSTDKTNASSSSFKYEQDSSAYVLPKIVAIKDKSISGVSQKGPFVTGSTVKLYELDGKTYASTGKSFPGKIASDDGKFSVSSINLASQYALIEATGYFRNEITGEKSSGTISLNALTDLSNRKTVNINLLTHLEYERVLYLVETGINISAAKKQAEAEILNAFGIRGTFDNSEDLNVFNKGDGNAALLAISVLMLGRYDEELSAAELTERLAKFATDIEKDGTWDDEKTKAEIADWAAKEDAYYSDIREDVEEWKLGAVPDFEKYVRNFWYSIYGLGNCGTQNKGEVASIENTFSRYSKENDSYYGERQYVCRDGAWKWATPLDIDSYKSKAPENAKDGDIWTGPVTGTIYTYDTDAGGWVMSSSEEAELNIGGCTLKRNGKVAKASDGVYYICRTDYDAGCWWNDYTNMQQCKSASDSCYSLCTWYRWQEASEIEYDTYGKPCTSKEVGTTIYGAVTTTNKYECKKKEYGSSDYGWELVHDQYMEDVRRITEEVKNPTDGEIREGWDTRYKYDEELGKWEITNEMERYSDFGGCTTKRIGELAKFCEKDCSYYICGNVTNSDCNHDFLCSAHDWNPATEIEAETHDNECTSDKIGTITNGTLTATNMYYCSAKGWVSLMKWSWDIPKEAYLNPEISYETMTDSRDKHIYKTVKIGTQTWMAENLNYADSTTTPSLKGKSWCFGNKAENCEVAGRFYTWAAAIDSVALYDDGNGVDCGYGKICTLSATVRGICPNGWHLPSNDEWKILFNEVGGIYDDSGEIYYAGKVLKSQLFFGGSDSFGFSALPVGEVYDGGKGFNDGYTAFFWSSTEYKHSSSNEGSYYVFLHGEYDEILLGTEDKKHGYSVRCIKDTN